VSLVALDLKSSYAGSLPIATGPAVAAVPHWGLLLLLLTCWHVFHCMQQGPLQQMVQIPHPYLRHQQATALQQGSRIRKVRHTPPPQQLAMQQLLIQQQQQQTQVQ
jgi:hypothetical protein